MKEVVVIHTNQDQDVDLVAACLKKMGAKVTRYDQYSMLGRGNISVSLSGANARLKIEENDLSNRQAISFWNRRHFGRLASVEGGDEADHPEAEANALATMLGVRLLLDEGFAVNPTTANLFFSNSTKQLLTATDIGFKTPRTLISNCLPEIRTFAKSVSRCCVKPQIAYKQKSAESEDGAYKQFFATIVDDIDAFPLDAVAYTPLIYQEYIDKDFEVRIVAFGQFMSAVGIEPINREGIVDWKASSSYLRNLSPVTPPAEISSKIQRFMKISNLRFGIFDFVVDKLGGWYFLEVNTGGGFTWKEIYCDEVVILEPFCRFLMAGDDAFNWDASQRDDEFSAAVILDELECAALAPA